MNPNIDPKSNVHVSPPLSAVSAALTGQVNPLLAKTAAADSVTPNPVHSTAPAVADDGDLIEQEWVVKAKLIVMHTGEDPYEQNRQLAAFKADYLQKRYNKTIKLNQ